LSVDEFMMIMRRQFKQWWSTFTPISTKRTIASHLDSLNTKRPHYATITKTCTDSLQHKKTTYYHKNKWKHKNGQYNSRVNECS